MWKEAVLEKHFLMFFGHYSQLTKLCFHEGDALRTAVLYGQIQGGLATSIFHVKLGSKPQQQGDELISVV